MSTMCSFGSYVSYAFCFSCWSYVGRIGGAQSISLGDGCHSSATIEHEIGHAIGNIMLLLLNSILRPRS